LIKIQIAKLLKSLGRRNNLPPAQLINTPKEMASDGEIYVCMDEKEWLESQHVDALQLSWSTTI
jgi:hypothetical protein